MENQVIQIKTISELHEAFGLSKPKHPLVSIVRHADMKLQNDFTNQRFCFDMFMIVLKGNQKATLKYGRNKYDFQEGTMVFLSPNQIISTDSTDFSDSQEEWTILLHSDFISKNNLYDLFDKTHFFSYDSHEALHLSDDEKMALSNIVQRIESEYHQNIDKHTDNIIAVNTETLIKYCQRFYDRQFITRQYINKDLLSKFENYLGEFFKKVNRIPTVIECGEALNLSAYYLSDLLKVETGKTTKEHIDLHLINKAKNLLINSEKSVSEIAYELGFDYPNHFSKLFKSKIGLSPSEFRHLN
jgi:AraC-like DNA-binding protein